MLRQTSLLSVTALAIAMTSAAAQTPGGLQPRTSTLTFKPVTLSPRARLAALAIQPNRFAQIRALAQSVPVNGLGRNGLRYYLGRSAASLPAGSAGSTQITRQADNLVVCKTTPVTVAKSLAGPLFWGSGISANQSVIYPGALFKDTDIVSGQFTPQMLPRQPGTITIDVFNAGGGVSTTVQDFNDRTMVVNGINTLRTQTVNAATLTYLDYSEFTVAASQELSLGLEASTDIDVGPSLDMPIDTPFDTVGANAGVDINAAITTQNSQNFAIGMIDQTFYTISLGGAGPASTVQDSIGANILAVTDVQYGRIAFVIVSSVASSVSAKSVARELIEASNPFASVSQQSQLSAESQFALSSGSVRVKIVGGNTSSAVRVTDLATLRQHIENIKPTVGGSNAVPIRYTLRYARDNATALVAALASYNDRECARATQLKVKLKTLTPTKVVDFGDEELYGTVRVKAVTGLTPTDDGRTLWDVAQASAVQGRQNVAISIQQERTFNLNPLDAEPPASARLEFAVKDRIMAEEWVGATQFGKDNGFVKYGPEDGSVSLQDVRNAPNGKLSKSFTLTEVGGEPTVRLDLDFLLVPVF